jgi:hypothetical protein
MRRITLNVYNVKRAAHALSRAFPGCTVQRRRRKTIVTIYDGQIVITLKPP